MSSIIKISLEKNDGTMYYVTDAIDIEAITKVFPKVKFHKTTDKETLRRKYRAILTDAAKKKGYTREQLHESLKPILFGKFKDFPEYFIDATKGNSTTNLTLEGLSALIENLNDFLNNT